MRMYDYLITYTFNMEGYLTPSTGNSCISRKKKLKTIEDIKDLQQAMQEQIKGASNLAVTNLILLGRNKH